MSSSINDNILSTSTDRCPSIIVLVIISCHHVVIYWCSLFDWLIDWLIVLPKILLIASSWTQLRLPELIHHMISHPTLIRNFSPIFINMWYLYAILYGVVCYFIQLSATCPSCHTDSWTPALRLTRQFAIWWTCAVWRVRYLWDSKIAEICFCSKFSQWPLCSPDPDGHWNFAVHGLFPADFNRTSCTSKG